MAEERIPYKRLPGVSNAGTGLVAASRSYSRLYMGPDHLLRVTTGWTESYRRFFYSDIRAIVISRTKNGLVWNIILAVLCAIFLAFCLAIHDRDGQMVFLCFTALFGGLLIVNVARGPTCAVRIYTHVGCELLPSIKRQRTAKKVIAKLKPEIMAAQGQLSAEGAHSQPSIAQDGTAGVQV